MKWSKTKCITWRSWLWLARQWRLLISWLCCLSLQLNAFLMILPGARFFLLPLLKILALPFVVFYIGCNCLSWNLFSCVAHLRLGFPHVGQHPRFIENVFLQALVRAPHSLKASTAAGFCAYLIQLSRLLLSLSLFPRLLLSSQMCQCIFLEFLQWLL